MAGIQTWQGSGDEELIKHFAVGQLEKGAEKIIVDLAKSFPNDSFVIAVVDSKKLSLATADVAKIQGVANVFIAGIQKKKVS